MEIHKTHRIVCGYVAIKTVLWVYGLKMFGRRAAACRDRTACGGEAQKTVLWFSCLKTANLWLWRVRKSSCGSMVCENRGSELAVLGRAGEGDDVADVGHAGHEEQQALEAQAETAVGHGAEAARVEVPPHVLHGDVQLGDALHELVVVGLALAAADDLTYLREQHVHGAHGAAVGVLLHVEGLDFLGVVGEDDGLAEVLLHQIALVFALQVDAPLDGELKLVAAGLEYLDALGVGEAHEIVVQHKFEALDEALVEVLGEEVDVVAAVVEHIADAVLDKLLGQVHVVGDVVKGHLGLNHPELAQVALGIGVLGAESGAEGIYLADGGGAELALELAADGERGGLAEEVAAVVDGAVVGAGHVGEGQGGHLEHGSGSLAVARGDERGVEVVEALVLEEAVHGVGQGAADAQDGAEGIGARAQVGYLAQELERVAFLLQGILVGIGGAVDLEGVGLYLDRLAAALRLHEPAGDVDRRAGGDAAQVVVAEAVHVEDYLQVADSAAVVERYKLYVFIAAAGAYPAAHIYLAPDGAGGEECGYLAAFHALG